MDCFKNHCRGIVDTVMGHLQVLEGTEYSDTGDLVRIDLSNMLQDLTLMVERNDILQFNDKRGLRCVTSGGIRYRVCHLSTVFAGEGGKAAGGVGLAWGEGVEFNAGMKVITNVVNKKTAEMWGLLAIAATCEARRYKEVMIVTENCNFTRRLLLDLKDKKYDGSPDCGRLSEQFQKVFDSGLDIKIPDDVQLACIQSSMDKVSKTAKKLAKSAFDQAKRENKN